MQMISLLMPEQLKELESLEATVAHLPDRESAVRLVVVRLGGILGTTVALIERRGSAWHLAAASGDVPTAPTAAAAFALDDQPSITQLTVALKAPIAEKPWTTLHVRPSQRRPAWLIVAGDWTLSEALLRQTTGRLFGAVAALPGATLISPRRELAAYRLARRLARTDVQADIHTAILESCARSVGAEKASLAIYDDERRHLVIAATYGYPAVFVKHVRIAPGDGVIGRVFRTSRPLLVDDIRQQQKPPRPRLRYRTPSFVAVPILGKGRPLGVISVSDRADGREFDRRDLGTLKSLAGVASLALDRARARDSAEARARDAAVDPLTGLFNRRHFLTRLEEEVERARRQSTPLSLLMFDIDHFKQVNDRLGHLAGDTVLQVVADVARRSVRLFDVCARYGGDEFAVLMPGSGGESSAQIAERLRQGIEESRPGGGPWSADLRISASIGIAMFIDTGENLLAHADQALYDAKRAGRNRVSISRISPPV